MVVSTDIPEIIHHIGTHLDPPHLYTSMQVCRSWNNVLVPLLWTSIDDSNYSWNRILDSFLEERRMNPSDSSGGEWARGVFLKYGHLIQHLHITRREVLDAVCGMHACTLLKTLKVGKMEPTGFQELEHEWMYDLSPEEQQEMVEVRWTDAMGNIVDSITFQQAFVPRSQDLRMVTLAQQEVDWEVTKEFWRLLRENWGLQVLRLDESLGMFMDHVSSEYFVETLRLLEDLTDLENDFVDIDLAVVLEVLPGLKRYTKFTNLYDPLSLTQPARRLTHVELKTSATCHKLLQFLKDAPNLVSLSIRHLKHTMNWCTPEEAEALMDDTPSQLQRLQIGTFEIHSRLLLETVLPWMPNLTTLHLTQLYPGLVRSFVHHCSELTTIEGSNVGPILQVTPGRWQENHETGALEEMIKGCPNLVKIDWIGRTLNDTSLWDYVGVWPNLTFLRCQIGGLKTLPVEYEAIWKQIKGLPGPFRHQENKALQLQESIRREQRLVLSRIGSLRNLRTLDIGADFRLHKNTTWANCGQGGTWAYGKRPKMYDCLRLSLEMGLDELARLKDLEVFGFEGIEHEIEEADLGWICENWRRLKVMRGLFSGHLLAETEEDLKKARLQDAMRKLRPDVVHEPSGVCIMVPLS
ncbi:hypothetical protein BGZ96_007859 [Linnemannia gamsii]|uniref:F-box domain-containing protein n=1 Tax=Linnemannia gamsii TaxID=64522 RepID=A0ABQ7K0J3_9FUNG|nr:hypothetical protein BGZ96_007859 [Linnemannia gamsii]